MKGQMFERDLGWERIRRDLKKLDNMAVDVGIQSDSGSDEDGTPIALYAAVNEFGSANGHTPERSFMRSSFDDNVEGINRTVKRLRNGVIDGRVSPERAGDLLGLYHTKQVQQKIGSNVPPANAPSTVKRKGSSATLIDDGVMRQTIRHEVRSKAAWWKFW